MKESASIALDYLKANKEKYGLDDKAFEKQDIHIHVPEGAIKKDGPSAGVTLTTAIYSAFTNKPVRDDVAMTGEINLRGNVLPIGGLKENLFQHIVLELEKSSFLKKMKRISKISQNQ